MRPFSDAARRRVQTSHPGKRLARRHVDVQATQRTNRAALMTVSLPTRPSSIGTRFYLGVRAIAQRLISDSPHLHSVIRLRVSYTNPSAASSVTPPRSQIGPLHSSSGSSTRPIEIGNLDSTGSPVARSHATNRPDGYSPTCRRKSERTCGSSAFHTCVQTFPFGSQKRPNAQRFSTSVNSNTGPSISLAWPR